MWICQPSSVPTRSENGCAIRRYTPPPSSITSRTAYASETASHIFSTTRLSLHPTWNHPASRNHPAQQTPREQKVENNEGQVPSTTTSRWPSRVFGTCSNVLGSLERRGGLRRLVGGKTPAPMVALVQSCCLKTGKRRRSSPPNRQDTCRQLPSLNLSRCNAQRTRELPDVRRARLCGHHTRRPRIATAPHVDRDRLSRHRRRRYRRTYCIALQGYASAQHGEKHRQHPRGLATRSQDCATPTEDKLQQSRTTTSFTSLE